MRLFGRWVGGFGLLGFLWAAGAALLPGGGDPPVDMAPSAGVEFVPTPAKAQKPGTAAPGPVRLFEIRRNLNANRVAYDLALSREGSIETEDPIRVYWLLAKGGTEPLSAIERRKAYGAKVHVAAASVVRFTLKPLPTRIIDVRVEGGRVEATTSIAGEKALIRDIFVEATGGLIPGVAWVELRGNSLQDGSERIERIIP